MRRVLVVGGGPAGLAAARAASEQHAAVTLIEADDQLGGQYFRRPSGAPLPSAALPRGVDVRLQTSVWAIERPAGGVVVHTVTGEPDGAGRPRSAIRADAIVLAPGAHDRVLPFPGWDLPGVFTAGGAQTLTKADGVRLGGRVLVAGTGPFLLPVAAALTGAGSRVVGVYEAARPGRLAAGWLSRPWGLAGSASKVPELARYVTRLVRHRIPYHPGWAVVAAHGTDRVEAVTVARVDDTWSPIPGGERRVAAAAVCVGHGFTARTELAVAAGCGLDGEGFVVVGRDQRTSAPDVYAAGEVTGIAGAVGARWEGTIAGHCAAGGDPSDSRMRGARRSRTAAARFAVRLAAAHPVGGRWVDWLTDDTVVCRCEEVTAGRLREVQRRTASAGLRPLRLTTRAGLGPCQGRMCAPAVAALLAGTAAAPPPAALARRPIAAPIRLGELAENPAPEALPTPTDEGIPTTS